MARKRMNALATQAHGALTLMHLQGVVYHLADPENRDLRYALAHGAAAIFSGASFLRHLRENGEPEGRRRALPDGGGLADYYEEVGK